MLQVEEGAWALDLGRYRPETAHAAQASRQRILDGALSKAKALVGEHAEALEGITEALVAKDRITGEELEAIVKGCRAIPKSGAFL